MKFFVFDVESIGLHGTGYAVGGGTYSLKDGVIVGENEFRFAVDPDTVSGTTDDREWVAQNIPPIPVTHSTVEEMRSAFWAKWMEARSNEIKMAVDCGWPVEANFLSACAHDDPARKWQGPYPLVEISSIMLAAGLDPLANHDRNENELPKHDPLADARQSARILFFCL